MAKMKKSSLNLAIISPIMSQANVKPFFDCVDIFTYFANNIFVIISHGTNVSLEGGKACSIYKIQSFSSNSKIIKIMNYLLVQLKITIQLLLHRKDIDISIFYMGDGFLLPIFIAKLLKKKVVLILGGSIEEALKLNYNPLYEVIVLFKKINLKFSDHIILYSPILIDKWNLTRYANKISIAHKHHIDFNEFCEVTKYEDRELFIGYIGCLSEIKGVFNFVKSLPKTVSKYRSIQIIIGGSGPLKDEIEHYVIHNDLSDFVEFVGWIPHKELASYLNKLKLIVLPSYTEGLPNIVLESMACGTPVLATPVGAIPDILTDGKTGFIMESNSSECIEMNLIRALNAPNLSEVSKNGKKLIESKFSYASSVRNFENIFKGL